MRRGGGLLRTETLTLVLAGILSSHCGGGPGAPPGVGGIDINVGAPDKRTEVIITSETGVITAAQRDAALSAIGSSGLQVVHAGAEPRQLLTYALAAGPDQVFESNLGARVERTGAAVVDRRERVAVRVAFEQKIAGRIEILATLIEPGESQAESTGISTAIAVFTDGRSPTPTPRDADLRPCAVDREALREVIAGSVIRLPDRAVGVGAKWQVLESKSKSGTELVQLTNAELVAVQGDLLTISHESRAYVVNVGATLENDITRFSSKTTWRMTVDRRRPLPVLVDITAHISTAGLEDGKDVTIDVETFATATLRDLRTSDPAPAAPGCVQREQALATECAALIESVNTGQTVFKEIGSDAKVFEEHARKVDQFGVAVAAVDISDKTLLKHRAEYRAMVSDMAQVLRDAAKGDSSVEKRIDNIVLTEDRLVEAINTRCNR